MPPTPSSTAPPPRTGSSPSSTAQHLHAVDAATGSARWVSDLDALGGHYAIAHADGIVYVSTKDGFLRGFDLETGSEVWGHQLSAPAESLTISDGVAYAGTTAGEIMAISLADGSVLWRPVRLLSDRPSSMPLAGGMLHAGSIQPPGEPAGELLAIDAANGEVAWRFRSPSGRQAAPGAVHGGVVYVASRVDGLYALDARSGAVLWRADTPQVQAPASLAGDAVIVVGVDGELFAFDRVDGTELWRVLYGSGKSTGPAITGGLIFQADGSGTLMAFGDRRLASAGGEMATGLEAEVAAAGDDAFVHISTWDASTIEGLDQPCGGDMGPDGLSYFANRGTSEVIVLGADGAVVRRWGGPGSGAGELDFLRDPNDPFSAIGGVAASSEGLVFVADTVNRRIQQFTPEGEFVRQFGSYGTGDGQFLEPFDLDVGPDGSVYVVDDVRDDIQRFSADGKYLQTIGRHGTGDGELQFTGSVVVTDDVTLLNADWDNNRVQAWDADGGFLWSVGERGSDLGEFRLPGDVAVDSSGLWFATDFDNGRVQVFGADNEPLGEWAIPAIEQTGPGYSITAAVNGRLYVNLPFGDAIAVIEYLGS